MTTYASVGNVETLLGQLKGRLPTSLDPIETFLDVAHADVLDRLLDVYGPQEIPTFAGPGLTAVTWAEAKIAAAEILDAVRINLPNVGDTADRLRASAYATLKGGVPGYVPGQETVTDPDDPDGPGTAVSGPGPRVSSFTAASAFPDPYAELRDYGISGL